MPANLPTIAESKRKIREMGWVCVDIAEVSGAPGLVMLRAYPIAEKAYNVPTIKYNRLRERKRQAYADLATFIKNYCQRVEG